jgi:hypothetical protein
VPFGYAVGMRKSRPPLFKWRHFEPAVITCAVGWYLRFSLSYRNVEELLTERGLPADHTTVWRWVQCYSPELNKRCRRELKPTNRSWRVDETYVRVNGKWTYLTELSIQPAPRLISGLRPGAMRQLPSGSRRQEEFGSSRHQRPEEHIEAPDIAKRLERLK